MEEGDTMLVVEDEAMIPDMAEVMQESFGFTVMKQKTVLKHWRYSASIKMRSSLFLPI